MALEVNWTNEAKNQFVEILDYWTQRNGSSFYSQKLLILFDQSIQRLLMFPELGRKTNIEKIRLKIIKEYFLYYTINSK